MEVRWQVVIVKHSYHNAQECANAGTQFLLLVCLLDYTRFSRTRQLPLSILKSQPRSQNEVVVPVVFGREEGWSQQPGTPFVPCDHEYLSFRGGKFSKSRGAAVDVPS